jgi:hypothetical protein
MVIEAKEKLLLTSSRIQFIEERVRAVRQARV